MPNLSLKLKLTLGAVTLGISLLLAQSFLQFYGMREELSKRIEEQQFTLLSEVANHLDEKIDERLQALMQAGTTVPLQAMNSIPALERHLRDETALLSMVDDLYIFDAKGLLLVDWPEKPGRRALDMSSRDYIQGVQKTLKPFISKPVLGKSTGQPIVVLAAPILNAKGELAGIIGGVLNLYKPNLIGALPDRKIGNTGYFYLVSADGTTIAHPDKRRIMKTIARPNQNPLLDRAMAGFEGSGEGVNSSGLQGLFTFKRLQSTGWILASVVPTAEAFRPVIAIQQRMILITLLLMAFVVPLLWAFARHLVGPLGELAEAMRQRAINIRPGERAEAIIESGSQEIRTVAHAFNHFLEARNHAEGALAAIETRMSHVVENVSDGIWDWHLADNHLYSNPALQSMLDFDAGQAAGNISDFENCLHPDDREMVHQALRACLSGKSDTYLSEHRMLTMRGRTIWVIARGRIVERNADRQATRMLGTLINVSERRERLEQLARAKEHAEAANRAKSEFLANMSHEIRTPMNGIIGMTDILLDSPHSPEQQEHLDIVKTSAYSLLTIINDILDFSKIESGKLQIETVAMDVGKVIAATLRSFTTSAHEKHLELIDDVAPDMPLSVLGDPSRLRQVLVNLIGNALKFTEHGQIVVRARLAEKRGDRVIIHIAVADTGIGIPQHRQQDIFDAFAQVDSSTTRHYGGTGLGLSISKRLVELMHGRMWLESTVGEGSTFHFTVEFVSDLHPGVIEPSRYCLEGRHALIVDDNAVNRKVLTRMLGNWGISVETADSGRTAIARIMDSGKPFDCLLLDAQMPAMNGFQLAEALQMPAFDTVRPPLIMLSSGTNGNEMELCRKVGISDYLNKPVDAEELRKMLCQILVPLEKQTVAAPYDTPLPATTASAGNEQAHSSTDDAPLKVLLVEDHLVNQKLVVILLKKWGYLPYIANHGQEALTMMAAERFDAILMDMQMPVMGGLDATREIRRRELQNGLPRMPIIAMTANAMQSDREACLASGMDDYIAKPITPSDLHAKLAAIHAGKREMAEVPR